MRLGRPVVFEPETTQRTLIQDLALLAVAVLAMGAGWVMAALAIRIAS